MNITSAKFVKGIVGSDPILENDTPQVAFIGRSNAGKSSVINYLTNQKNLARTSSAPGRTKEINLFLINDSFYLVDLPGYGFAKASYSVRENLEQLIAWYLFQSPYVQQKVVLIIDANVGPTSLDMEMLYQLEEHEKDIIIVANKIDKLKKSKLEKQLQNIAHRVGSHTLIPFSTEKKIGREKLLNEILN